MAPQHRAQDSAERRSLIDAIILVCVGLLATSLAQPQILAGIPLENLLKNQLHASREANAAFFFWASLAWYFKPIAGLITDSFPLFGSRRKSYLVVSSVLAAAAWIGLYFTPHEYHLLLWVTTVINVFMVFASTVVGAYLVEIAHACSSSGRLSAVRDLVEQAALIVSGPAAGYLGSIAFGWTAAVCGGVMFLVVPATILFLQERPLTLPATNNLTDTAQRLGKVMKARYMWWAAGLMVLFYMAPGLSTAIFYKQQNDLHLDTQAQGTLELVAAITGIAAALLYAYMCRKLNLRTLLLVGLSLATVADAAYLLYSSYRHAQVIEGFNGFCYTLAELAILDLAIRATPAGSEGFVFSLMMSVRNFALFGTDWFGSALIDRLHWSFNSVVLADVVTTCITIPVVLVLPVILVRRRDDQSSQPGLAVALQQS